MVDGGEDDAELPPELRMDDYDNDSEHEDNDEDDDNFAVSCCLLCLLEEYKEISVPLLRWWNKDIYVYYYLILQTKTKRV